MEAHILMTHILSQNLRRISFVFLFQKMGLGPSAELK